VSFCIREAELREIRLPLVEPFRISSGVEYERRILLLRLVDDSGTSVWAECVAGALPNYSPETIDTAWLALTEWLLPRVLGRECESAGEVHGLLEANVRGHEMARAVLEMGAWGLEATRTGISLSKLLGGVRDRVETGISIGLQDTPELLVEKAEQALALGYRKIKLKIAPGRDLEYVAAVREALGREVSLAVDANCAYSLVGVPVFEALDDLGLLMIEQPLGADDLVRHAELQRRLRTPLCLDESITSVERAEDMVSLGSGRIINIKPGRVGGYATSRAIHDLSRDHGFPVWCGGMLESGIGRAYNVALASLENFVLPGDLSPSSRYWARDVVEPEWVMGDDGFVTVPADRPGLGIEVREDRIEELTVRAQGVAE
jgi:O-succinylbenzoate synthase